MVYIFVKGEKTLFRNLIICLQIPKKQIVNIAKNAIKRVFYLWFSAN